MKLWKWSIILLATALASYALFSNGLENNNLKLGLDLVGGAQLVFQAKNPTGQALDKTTMQGLIKVFENRVNASGTAEATIQQVGSDRVLVEIPGVKPDLVKRRLLKTAQLEFREPDPLTEGWKSSGITGADLKRAQAGLDQKGSWAIFFEMKPEGGVKFGELTERLALNQSPLGIFLDGKMLSAPRVQTRIGADGQITGQFSPEEAQDLAVQLNAGALPVPVELISERTVGATLGKLSLEKSMQAGLFGLGLVALFMIVIYRVPGVIATVALLLYTLLSLGLFTQGIVLTLAGIAGFILSIGMAVDANVLVFERIKEEFRSGKPIYKVVEEGFNKAFPSIFDSNLNTLLVCSILFFFGSGLVRGFAVTLALGVIVSFFTAIFITRELMELALKFGWINKPELIGASKPS